MQRSTQLLRMNREELITEIEALDTQLQELSRRVLVRGLLLKVAVSKAKRLEAQISRPTQ